MMSHFPVVFCGATLRANTLIQEGTDGIRWNQRLSSVRLFIVVISFPSPSCVPSLPSCLFTLSSAPHLPPLTWCTFCCLSFPPAFWFPLSSISPAQCGPAPIDPLIEISAQQTGAQKGKCYFEVISEGPGRAVGSSPASRAVSGIRLRTTQI